MPIREMDWTAHIGQQVRIYRNLNNGRMSIQAKVGKSWKVVGHVQDAVLQDVTFSVSERGRQRVIAEGCKNVHAWGQGLLLGQFQPELETPIELGYNPYTDSAFLDKQSRQPIQSCLYLIVRENTVFVSLDAVGNLQRPRLIAVAGGKAAVMRSPSKDMIQQLAA